MLTPGSMALCVRKDIELHTPSLFESQSSLSPILIGNDCETWPLSLCQPEIVEADSNGHINHKGKDFMKIKKTITPKGIAANRANAQKSTGPRNTVKIRNNAIKHGLLIRQLIFQDDEDRAAFNLLRDEVLAEYKPSAATELVLVEEIATCVWKLQLANKWESQEIENRRKATKALLRAVAENYGDDRLSLLTQEDGSRSAAQFGWHCEELVVRSGHRNSEQGEKCEEILDDEKKEKTSQSGEVHVEARLRCSIENILRYEASIKRDLYRAIGMLRAIKRDGEG